jgi:hypothetical protein
VKNGDIFAVFYDFAKLAALLFSVMLIRLHYAIKSQGVFHEKKFTCRKATY